MATYEDLKEYFDRSESFRRIAAAAAEVPIFRGVTLDVDPLWMYLYDIEEGLYGPYSERDRWVEFFILSYLSSYSWLAGDWLQLPIQGYRKRDLNRVVGLWHLMNERLGRKHAESPVILTIVHRPMRTPVSETAFEDETARQRLIAIANVSDVRVRVEERPEASLAFAPGDGVATDKGARGTFGGTLTGQNGEIFGMTCAHVAQTGDCVFDYKGIQLGICKYHTDLVPLRSGAVCNPAHFSSPNPLSGNGPSMNMLDVSLIELTEAPKVARSLSGVATSLTIGQDVVVEGVSRRVRCLLGSLAISYSFGKDGKSFCFRDVIELRPRPRFKIGGVLGTIFSPLPVPGDSGAWVLTNEMLPAWAGVFFGEDGQRGFCIPSSLAHAWAQSMAGPLSV